MTATKANIISQLRKEIFSLQGLQSSSAQTDIDLGLGAINYAFPGSIFPLSAVHEFIGTCAEDLAATSAFISCLVSSLIKNGSVAVWISSSATIFPPALKPLGISPDKIIFIHSKSQKEVLWIIEEALKCEGLAAVIAEVKELGFTESRRLQLAVEKSHVTGFVIRSGFSKPGINACVSRWRITAHPSVAGDDLPGIGFPAWKIELLKIRNGKPGNWNVSLINGRLQIAPTVSVRFENEHRKIG
ncbi:MAG TPA: hypothetical protein VMT76_07090 [Puia sp.]|nr:hypothetical protein [Puia sp.]